MRSFRRQAETEGSELCDDAMEGKELPGVVCLLDK